MRERDIAFCMGLELTQSIYERLLLLKRLSDSCCSCPVMIEISKLLDLSKGRQLEELEKEIGYYLACI